VLNRMNSGSRGIQAVLALLATLACASAPQAANAQPQPSPSSHPKLDLRNPGRAVSANIPGPLPNPNIAIWAPGQVNAILPLPDGSVIIGGQFETVFDPVSELDFPRSGLAKFLPNGALDLAWNPRISSLNRIVYDLERDASNRIYVAGQFDAINDVPRQNVARLSATGTGTLDANWAPNVSRSVVDVTLDDTGTVYFGGFFTSVNGVSRNGVARLNAESGALDMAWNPDVQSSGGVYVVAPKPGGDVYIGGGFNSVGGITRNGLARIQRAGSGALDPAWNPAQASGALVYDLQLLPNGDLLVGGQFSEIGGLVRRCIAQIFADGAGGAVSAWNSPISCGFVEDLDVDANGNVYIAGFLGRQPGDFGDYQNLAKLTSTGAIDASWNASADGFTKSIAKDNAGRVLVGGAFGNTGLGFSLAFTRLNATNGSVALAHFVQDQGQIYTATAVGDGSVIIGGKFARVSAQRRLNLFKLDPSGVLDFNWVIDTNEYVRATALDSQGRVMIGGRFTRAEGMIRRRVFRATTTGTGEIDPLWNPNADNDVDAIAAAPNGSVYLGGSFQTLGAEQRYALGKVAGSGIGAVDQAWSMAATPTSGVFPFAVAVDADGSVFVGGEFTALGGAPRAGLAKLSGSTGDALAWNPGPTGGVFGATHIGDLLLDGLGSIYVGGDFTAIGGRSLRGVAKLSTTGGGAADPGWTTSANFPVFAMAMNSDGDLYAASGGITDGAGFSRPLVRLPRDLSGAVDESWNPSPNFPPNALAIRADGNLFMGGSFLTVGGRPRQSIAVVPARVDLVFSDGFQ